MGDCIRLSGLRFLACHGALPHEKTVPQEFSVDIELSADLSPAGTSDRLAETVDYGEVARRVAAVMNGRRRNLLETLAEDIFQSLKGLPGVLAVRVRVKKMAPPLGILAASAEVDIERHT